MNDKTVLITGCSSGIGYCVAQGLKQRGYGVIATARCTEDVARLREEGFDALQLDLDDSASIRQALAQAAAQAPQGIYGLFNNGAWGLPGAVEDLSREALRAQFETNLFGTMELTNRMIRLMRVRGGGRIIQNSSVLGLVAFPYRGAYNASKFALEGMTDTLRMELRGSGIHISLIEPGPIVSRFRENAFRRYQQYIAKDDSAHRSQYEAMEQRLLKEGPAAPFTLPPEAVLAKVVHALESPRPRIRYYVTFPTWLFAVLRRLLPAGLLDRALIKASGDGSR
jgi:NAD(P)-dependent dehydrogenase (short-subunit alcohol dehydrogenase family)